MTHKRQFLGGAVSKRQAGRNFNIGMIMSLLDARTQIWATTAHGNHS